MLQEALRDREALDHLTQDLGHFNLEYYRNLEGHYSLDELGAWLRTAILRLGGGAIPVGDFWTFVCPESLQQKYRLLPRYEKICFNRELALRTRGCELGGIGHSLVDALLEEIRSGSFTGEVGSSHTGHLCARYLVRRRDERDMVQSRVITLAYDPTTLTVRKLSHYPTDATKEVVHGDLDLKQARSVIESALEEEITNWLPGRQARIGLTINLVGIHM